MDNYQKPPTFPQSKNNQKPEAKQPPMGALSCDNFFDKNNPAQQETLNKFLQMIREGKWEKVGDVEVTKIQVIINDNIGTEFQLKNGQMVNCDDTSTLVTTAVEAPVDGKMTAFGLPETDRSGTAQAYMVKINGQIIGPIIEVPSSSVNSLTTDKGKITPELPTLIALPTQQGIERAIKITDLRRALNGGGQVEESFTVLGSEEAGITLLIPKGLSFKNLLALQNYFKEMARNTLSQEQIRQSVNKSLELGEPVEATIFSNTQATVEQAIKGAAGEFLSRPFTDLPREISGQVILFTFQGQAIVLTSRDDSQYLAPGAAGSRGKIETKDGVAEGANESLYGEIATNRDQSALLSNLLANETEFNKNLVRRDIIELIENLFKLKLITHTNENIEMFEEIKSILIRNEQGVLVYDKIDWGGQDRAKFDRIMYLFAQITAEVAEKCNFSTLSLNNQEHYYQISEQILNLLKETTKKQFELEQVLRQEATKRTLKENAAQFEKRGFPKI